MPAPAKDRRVPLKVWDEGRDVNLAYEDVYGCPEDSSRPSRSGDRIIGKRGGFLRSLSKVKSVLRPRIPPHGRVFEGFYSRATGFSGVWEFRNALEKVPKGSKALRTLSLRSERSVPTCRPSSVDEKLLSR